MTPPPYPAKPPAGGANDVNFSPLHIAIVPHTQAEETVDAARNLLDKLGGEKSRWVTQDKSLGADLSELPLNRWVVGSWRLEIVYQGCFKLLLLLTHSLPHNDSLLTAAFITYLPMMPEEARLKVQRDWLSYLRLQVWEGVPGPSGDCVPFPFNLTLLAGSHRTMTSAAS